MAFGVEDFQDLVRLVEQHPEWRAELRWLVLTEELLELPAVVRELAEAQRRTAEQLQALTTQVRGLAEALQRLEASVQALTSEVKVMRDQFGEMRGQLLEIRYREHAGGYFAPLVRRVRLVGADELDDLLDEGLTSGALDEAATRDVRLADLLLRGRRHGEDRDTYLVVEVSAGVGPSDVERAARRAGLLGRLRPALAVVAGERVTPEATSLAEALGVRRVLDGGRSTRASASPWPDRGGRPRLSEAKRSCTVSSKTGSTSSRSIRSGPRRITSLPSGRNKVTVSS